MRTDGVAHIDVREVRCMAVVVRRRVEAKPACIHVRIEVVVKVFGRPFIVHICAVMQVAVITVDVALSIIFENTALIPLNRPASVIQRFRTPLHLARGSRDADALNSRIVRAFPDLRVPQAENTFSLSSPLNYRSFATRRCTTSRSRAHRAIGRLCDPSHNRSGACELPSPRVCAQI